MTAAKHTTVIGVFDNHHDARKAIDELRLSGFKEEEVGVATRDRERLPVAEGKVEAETHAGDGAVAGTGAGAAVGGLWALGIAAGMLPAIGPVIAGGTLASVLASAAGGAALGSVAGALVGLGIPDEDARYYEAHFKAGRVIVTVKAGERREQAADILHRRGAYNRTSAAVVNV